MNNRKHRQQRRVTEKGAPELTKKSSLAFQRVCKAESVY